MNSRASGCARFILLGLALSGPLRAQGTLSGNVSAPSGAAVANAGVSLKRIADGRTTETRTDSGGRYRVPDLMPGDYKLSVAAEGYGPSTVTVTVVAGVDQTKDVQLHPPLSLEDLGFSVAQTQGSAAEQARLDKRSHMLKVHQRLGLITTIPLAATAMHPVDGVSHAARGKGVCIGNDPGEDLRLQDRPADAPHDSHQERNPGLRGVDMASKEVTTTSPRGALAPRGDLRTRPTLT